MNQCLRRFKSPEECTKFLASFQRTAEQLALHHYNNITLSGWFFSISNCPCRWEINSKWTGPTYNHYCPDTKEVKPVELAPPGNWLRGEDDDITEHFSTRGCHRLALDDYVLCLRRDGIYRHKVGECDCKGEWKP